MGRGCPMFDLQGEIWVYWIHFFFGVSNIRIWESFGEVGSVRWVKIEFRFCLLFLGVWKIYKFLGRGCPIFNLWAEIWVCRIEIFSRCHLGSLIRMCRTLLKLGLWRELGQSSVFTSSCWNLRILVVYGSRMSNVYSAEWVHFIGIFI